MSIGIRIDPAFAPPATITLYVCPICSEVLRHEVGLRETDFVYPHHHGYGSDGWVKCTYALVTPKPEP